MYWLISTKSQYFNSLDECLDYVNTQQLSRFAIYRAVDYGWRLITHR